MDEVLQAPAWWQPWLCRRQQILHVHTWIGVPMHTIIGRPDPLVKLAAAHRLHFADRRVSYMRSGLGFDPIPAMYRFGVGSWNTEHKVAGGIEVIYAAWNAYLEAKGQSFAIGTQQRNGQRHEHCLLVRLTWGRGHCLSNCQRQRLFRLVVRRGHLQGRCTGLLVPPVQARQPAEDTDLLPSSSIVGRLVTHSNDRYTLGGGL
jgi:hypothetical protein